jgi:hypothetical protein
VSAASEIRAPLTSRCTGAEGNARRQPEGDRAVITYWAPKDTAGDFFYPPMTKNPTIMWYKLREPLPAIMIHYVSGL